MKANLFEIDPSGWGHAAPFGEHELWLDSDRKIVQVVDERAVDSIVGHIRAMKAEAEAAGRTWEGLLVNKDHLLFTNPDADSEAMAWIMDAEKRADGLWLNSKYTTIGTEKIEGGVYKFYSPEFDPSTSEALGGNRKRPMRLVGAAFTNKPNLRGLHPLCNRAAKQPDNPAERLTMNELQQIAEALGLGPDADLAAVIAKAKEVSTSMAEMNKQKQEAEAEAFCNSHKEQIQDVDAVRALYLKDPESAKAWMNSMRKPVAPPAAKPPVTTTVAAQTPAGVLPDGAFRDETGKVWANRLAFHKTLTGGARRKHLREHKAELMALENAE